MAELLLEIDENPQAFPSGTWPSVEMNGSKWRFTFTFTSSSASGVYAGYHALFTAPNGGNSGGLWIVGASLEFYNLADQILVVRDPMTWPAGATLRLTFDMIAKTILIGGMTTGNGLVSWGGSGPYFNGLDTLTAGGLVGEVGYDIAGTFGNIDDGVDKLVIDSADVAIMGTDVRLLANRRLVVDTSAAVVTAADVGLSFQKRLSFDAATVGITAEDLGLLRLLRLAADSEVVAATPSDIGLKIQRRMAIETTTVAITTSAIGGVSSEDDSVTLLENAIFGWVSAGSGLPDGSVIWGRNSAKNGPMPSGTFISMRLLDMSSPCNGWVATEEVDGEIVHRISEPGYWTLEVTCFHADPFGANRAQLILKRLLASVRLPSVREQLRAGNVGVGRRGPIRLVDGTRSGMLDPRAIVEIGLHVMIEVSEVGASIERALVTTETPETGEVETWVPEPPP